MSKEQRAEGDAVFLQFQKSKSPYEFCRYLLGMHNIYTYSLVLNYSLHAFIMMIDKLDKLFKKTETCKEPYVLYQAVSAMQQAALREWTLLPDTFALELQVFLLSYVTCLVQNEQQQQQQSALAAATDTKYVQRHILQTLAVFYKRGKVGQQRRGVAATSAATATILTRDAIDMFNNSPDVKLVVLFCSFPFN